MSRNDSEAVTALRQRRDILVSRINDINAELARGKLAWATTGVGTPWESRLALESERADLVVEKTRIGVELYEVKEVESAARRATFVQTIISVLEARGLTDVIDEARRIIADQEAAG